MLQALLEAFVLGPELVEGLARWETFELLGG